VNVACYRWSCSRPTPALDLRAMNVRVHNWTASFKHTAPDRCKRWLGGNEGACVL